MIKRAQLLSLSLLFTGLLFLSGCQSREEKELRSSIDKEFSLLQAEDTQKITDYFSDSLLLKDFGSDKIPTVVPEVFRLYFRDFSYKINHVSFNKKKTKADVELTLDTLDGKKLAKAYNTLSIQKQLESLAAPQSVAYTLDDYYHNLKEVLSREDLPKREVTCTVVCQLQKDGSWKMDHSLLLENAITGGFASSEGNPDLFTPEETTKLYLDKIRSFNQEQMSQFLSLDSLFTSDEEFNRSLSKAMASQIQDHFDYKILKADTKGRKSRIRTRITTADWKSIMENYTKKVHDYTESSQALEDGAQKRLTHTNQLLLEAVKSNKAKSTTDAILSLENNGANWVLQMDNQFTKAILGSIPAVAATITEEAQQ